MPGLRQHNGAQRRLLQMHELRHHERVLVRWLENEIRD